MGRATINSEIGEGEYNITVHYDRTRSDAEILRLEAENEAVNEFLSEIGPAIISAELEVDFKYEFWQAQISNFNSGFASEEDVNDAQKDVFEAIERRDNLKKTRDIALLNKQANEKRIAFIEEKATADLITTAWCADYNVGLTGEVGTIEVGRIAGANIIRPAGEDGDQAVYSGATDGKLEPMASSTGTGWFYNYAMQPGTSKWLPRFRTGIATSIDTQENIMNVLLDSAIIAGQYINQTPTLSEVPVVYMSCHAEAFEIGNHVVVEFVDQDWLQPRVIGFVTNPVPCELPPYVFIESVPYQDDHVSNYWELPFDNGLRIVIWDPTDIYDRFPGHLVDLRTGEVLDINHPDTDEPLTETERFDYQDNRIAWKGLYPEVIAEILGYDFINPYGDSDSNGTSVFGANGRSVASENKGFRDSGYVATLFGPDGWPFVDAGEFDGPVWTLEGTNSGGEANWDLFRNEYNRYHYHFLEDGTAVEDEFRDDGDGSETGSFKNSDPTHDIYDADQPHAERHEVWYRGSQVGLRTGSRNAAWAKHTADSETISNVDGFDIDVAADILGSSLSQVLSYSGEHQEVDPTRILAASAGGNTILFRHLARSVVVNDMLKEQTLDDGSIGGVTSYDRVAELLLTADNPLTYGTDRRDNASYDQIGGTLVSITETELADMMGLSEAEFDLAAINLNNLLFAIRA